MSRYAAYCLLAALLGSAVAAAGDPADGTVSAFCRALSGGKRILESPDWFVWDCAPIGTDDNKVHVLIGRWPKETGMAGWTRAAEIAHAVADHPEGPYEVTGVAIPGGGPTAWDRSVYNPNVHRIDGRFVLLFSGQQSGRQQIGMALADTPAGPWRKIDRNPIIRCSDKPGSWNCAHASNPSLVRHPDGRFLLYYKGMSDATPKLRTIGVAVAKILEGPYEDCAANPLISYIDKGGDIEDPYVFYYKDRFYMIAEDRMGVATGDGASSHSSRAVGGVRPGLLYQSADGFVWQLPQVGYMTNDVYMGPPRERFERPQILWTDGRPDYLFLALKGGRFGTSSGAVLKIGDW